MNFPIIKDNRIPEDMIVALGANGTVAILHVPSGIIATCAPKGGGA